MQTPSRGLVEVKKIKRMPRKKILPKFKYTVRKKPNNSLFVRYPNHLLKTMVWRKVEVETQDEVNKILDKLKGEIATQTRESGIPERCDKFFDYYLNLVKNNITERTLKTREGVVRLYLKPNLGYFDVAEIKPVQFLMIYQQMIDKKLAPLTIRTVHRVASSIFKEAVNLELIPSNPVSRVRPPKLIDNLKVKVMSKEEVGRFLIECRKHPHGIIFEFALETGMRPQEYLALRWTDIDLKKRTAQVVRALVYDRAGGGFYFKEPKTKKSRRTIPLSKQLCDKLIEHQSKQKLYIQELHERIRRKCSPYREYRKEINKQWLENHKELNLVFPSKEFTPLKDVNINKRYFKPIAAAAGLDKDLSPYSCRHTTATLLLQANINPKIVSERLGHAGIAITLETYSHVLPHMQEDATDRLASVLYE